MKYSTKERLDTLADVISLIDSKEAAGMRLSTEEQSIVKQSVDAELALLEWEMSRNA